MKLIRLIASPILMYVLAGVYTLVLVTVTLVKNSPGPVAAREYFYHIPWFILLQLLRAINLLAMLLQGGYFKGISRESLIFHGVLVFIWLGAAVTHYVGVTGIMYIRERETADHIICGEGAGMGDTSLPFSITLDNFQLKCYPGSHSPTSYESDPVIKKENEASLQATVWMNRAVEVDGYRLFQSSFNSDGQGTALSINYDHPGIQATYIGYFPLFADFMLTLFSKKSCLGRLYRELGEIKRNAPFCLLLFLGSSGALGTQASYARGTPSSSQPPYILAPYVRKFGNLVLLDPNGRLEPVSSYVSATLREFYGADELNSINPDQLSLNPLAFPDEWGGYPFIKVDNKDILQQSGRDGKYITWQDVFDADGDYVSTDEVNAIHAKSASERKRMDSDLLKLDGSMNIVYHIMQHQPLPPFPDEDGVQGKRYSASDEQAVPHDKDSLFVSKIMDWYIYELGNGVHTNNWKEADKTVDMMHIFQQAKSRTPTIDNQGIKAELFYNQLNLFFWCCLAYLILGGILLFIACGGTTTDLRWGSRLSSILIVLLIIAFPAYTTGALLHWYISERALRANAYGSMICTFWLLVGGSLLFAQRFRILPVFAGLLDGVMLFVARLNHPSPEITPSVPILQLYRLVSHVAIIIIDYIFFAFCTLTGLFDLILMSPLSVINRVKFLLRIREFTSLNEMAMILGLFFMTVGAFLGAIWANVLWGRYRGWDPKETWVLVSIVVYALVFHIRFIPPLKGKAAWCYNLLSAVSIPSIITTWFGINCYLSGSRSYRKVKGGGLLLWIWGAGLCVILALALLTRRRLKKYS